jgi:hypothetical protein
MIKQSREGRPWLDLEAMILRATAERRVPRRHESGHDRNSPRQRRGRSSTREARTFYSANRLTMETVESTFAPLATWARVGLLAPGPSGVPRPDPPDRAG